MKPIQLFDPASSTYTYLVFDAATRAALIIDPVREQVRRDLATLEELHLKLEWTLETHLHADHMTGAWALAQATGARMAAPAACNVTGAARQLQDGDTLAVGAETLRALLTPGHTAGCMCFVWQPHAAPGEMHVFTGDTLLIGGCGRTDFQSGDAGALYDSITQKLFALPGEAIVWPGHDYHEHTQSTLALERAINPRLAGKSRAQFIELMSALELPPPRNLDANVAANRRLGQPADAAPQPAAGSADQSGKAGQPEPAGADAEVTPAEGYAGDITPETAYAWMRNGRALLVDVRSDAERQWVGFFPEARVVVWKQWPGMVMNPAFDAEIQVTAQGGRPLMMMCQVGGRAASAARRAAELGLTAYRIIGGFDGEIDASGHRGNRNGWRHAGLPWQQK